MNRNDYENVVRRVRGLLSSNDEWRDRYKGYAQKLGDDGFRKQLERAVKQFRVPNPFQLYLPVSTAMKCNSSSTYLELRFRGQSVAMLRIDNRKDKIVKLGIKPSANVREALVAIKSLPVWYDAEHLKKIKWVDWQGDEAVEFRKLFTKLDKKIKADPAILSGQPEHEMESWLLKNYSKKSASEKEVVDIQPVKMPGTTACFQMPTPIRASKAKNGADNIGYSKQYGGGIDILARTGRGRATKLAVLELKDEFSDYELPQDAICQAIAYATFIRELIRDSECGEDWWKIFGFGGKAPAKLQLFAAIVMPYDDRADESFVKEGPLAIENDSISLGYIYRNMDSVSSIYHLC